MTDWLDELDDESRKGWDEFVDHFRRDALYKMTESAFVASIVPDKGFDVKFAAELGAAIMLNKPILAIVMPGAEISDKLRQVTDHVVEADLDVEEGRKKVAAAISTMLKGDT